MEFQYHSRYPQPFTLNEAARLDITTIAEEIGRLQNSLEKLKDTQEMLRAHLEKSKATNEADPELVLALQENEDVIASQEERIRILNMVLSQKGIISDNGHYGLSTQQGVPSEGNGSQSETDGHEHAEAGDDGGNGVFL